MAASGTRDIINMVTCLHVTHYIDYSSHQAAVVVVGAAAAKHVLSSLHAFQLNAQRSSPRVSQR